MDFTKKFKFTPRQQEAAILLRTGKSLKEIAHEMGITYSGIQFHARDIYKITQTKNRWEFMIRCIAVEKEGI